MRGFTLLLVAAAVASVSCADVWWESAVVYQIYPRSFKDSDGDGIGDLNGITSKLSYLSETGVDAIWLSPIYKSPMFDFGYDIEDYKAIATEYGTMDDFDNLMTEAKRLGIRVVLDYVPNHTSHLSEWFQKSVNKTEGYTDYYVWADGKTDSDNNNNTIPPNNWSNNSCNVSTTQECSNNAIATNSNQDGVQELQGPDNAIEMAAYSVLSTPKKDKSLGRRKTEVSVFRKSAWEYNAERGQFYLHQFTVQQPDVNYRSEKLREEMKDVLRFWLDKGVSGFRVDAVNMLYECYNGTYPDEPEILPHPDGKTDDDYEYLDHTCSKDQNETYEVVYDWRELLDNYTSKDNESKIMMTEAYTEMSLMMRYYGDGNRNGSVPFNFVYLEEMTSTSNATHMKSVVDQWMDNMPAGRVANWVNGNHDQSRLATRYGANRVDIMNMLALILPGVTITYQGEELGMTDGYISWANTKDPMACNTEDPIDYWKSSRDIARTPYHWDNTTSAGFSSNSSTWLPVADNYETVNLAAQEASTKSHYEFYKDVVALKHTPAVSSDNLGTYALSENVLLVTRVPTNNTAVMGIVNLSNQSSIVDLSSISGVPQNWQVVASGVTCTADKGGQVQRTVNITLPGNCAMALESVADTGAGGNNGTGNGTDTGGTGSANRLLVSFTLYSIIFIIYGYLVI